MLILFDSFEVFKVLLAFLFEVSEVVLIALYEGADAVVLRLLVCNEIGDFGADIAKRLGQILLTDDQVEELGLVALNHPIVEHFDVLLHILCKGCAADSGQRL